jgi:hypothetical protein
LNTIHTTRATRLVIVAIAASLLAAACGTSASDKIPVDAVAPGTTLTTTTTTTSKAVTVAPARTLATLDRTAATPDRTAATPDDTAATRDRAARERTVTIPSGTELQLSLSTAVASDTSRVEDTVTAELTNAVLINGRTALPAGSIVSGIVSAAEDSGRVSGRARVALDFTSVVTHGSRYPLSADVFSRIAAATKGEDATKIGVGAGAGAVIGGLLGGKKGAAEGAAVGGGAGTGVVLATKGREVRLARGADVSTHLNEPLTIRVAN